MDNIQLINIINNGETQEIEFKESFHSGQDISKVICAFANTLGGVLILGVTDKKEIIGLTENLDIIQQKIANSNQSVSPVPHIIIEIHKIQSKELAVIIVQKALDNTFHTFQGAIYVKTGSTTRRLEGQIHLDYLRNRQILSFDESYDPLFNLEDIDESKIRNYLRIRHQDAYLIEHSVKDFLLSNRLATSNGTLKIKNSAIIIFGRDPIKFHPQIEIKLVQFSSNEPVDIIAHKLIQEDIITGIDQSISFVKNQINKAIKIKEATREEIYEYPESVIREAVVNAIAHRDYYSKDSIQIYLFNDRLEITSPGSLPQGLTKDLFGTISVQRNPLTYRILRDMGYVEGLGTGIPRMKNEMRKLGLSDPEFKLSESFFRIVLYNEKSRKKPIEGTKDLNERQKKALEYLDKHKTIKAQTYTEINGVSNATSVKELNELIHYKFIKKIGTYKGAYYILNKIALN